jgi:DNA-binding FadR family transcriptional regulator
VADHQPEQAWQAMDRHLRQVIEQYEQGRGNEK